MEIRAVYRPDRLGGCTYPLARAPASAGFPSPADDFLEKRLDLNEYLIGNPAATFFVRVAGDSMQGAGIHDGDILVVDRSLAAEAGHVVIAVLGGEMVVKRLRRAQGKWWLVPENPHYRPLEIAEESGLVIWGVVMHVIHTLR